MKIAIIGAGCSGLAAARHSLADGHEVVVFEQNKEIGGTWIFTEETGIDENGIPVHSSMYEELLTNIPKELMEYEGFPYPSDLEDSFIPQPLVLKYMYDFMEAFKLEQYIKFNTQVIKIVPIEKERWSITTKDLKTKTTSVNEYDGVIVCNGHFYKPRWAELKGIERFKGNKIHSHHYRSKKPFINKKVVVLGAGPSGADIASLLLDVSEKVILSYKSSLLPFIPKKATCKPWIKEVFENSVQFEDGSIEEVTDLIFCTGYIFDYPFLPPECGIKVEDNFVNPLYKHMINIEHPTMAFLGLLTHIRYFPMADLQTKFILGLWTGKFTVTKQQMLADFNEHLEKYKESGAPLRLMHVMSKKQNAYCEELSEVSGLPNLPKFIPALYDYVLANYDKTVKYKVINDSEFVIV